MDNNLLDRKSLAERIVKSRARLKWNKSDLARASGLSKAAICLIEQGKRNLGFHTAVLLCDALGVSLNYLADKDYDKREMQLNGEIIKLKKELQSVKKIVTKY